MTRPLPRLAYTLLTSTLLMAFSATTQASPALVTAVEKALAGSPEVTSRLNAYRASVDAVDVAGAAWKPRLDLNASAGRDQDRISSRSPSTASGNRTGVSLTLSQLLWDGLGTRSDIARAGHDRLARYFELVDATEQTALEAARAHYDVLRFRRLVQLAEDNYVQHKYASLQIQSRFQAGVGRGVDLEQANARLALAESNLTTEVANLHDVIARYQRIVGEAPPERSLLSDADLAPLRKDLPAQPGDALTRAVQQSASISASIEALRAARATGQLREAAFQPRVEARLRGGGGHNYEGVNDQTRNATAEVVLNWNLYNGGADQARVRQQTHLLNQAADLRDLACRNTRQTVLIAFNDTRKFNEQLAYLNRNSVAISKARDAYRQQFDIGQRSLLDLLNAENELYTARRAYVNAEHDLAVSLARTQAGMSQLVAQLGLARPASTAAEAPGWSAGNDGPGRCPADLMNVPSTDRQQLDERARRLSASQPPAPASTPTSVR